MMSTSERMSSTDKSNDIWNSEDMIRMYYISSLQQAYQVALLFQSSQQNPDKNNNGTQLHSSGSMPYTFTNRVFKCMTTDLHNIIPNCLQNAERIASDSLAKNLADNIDLPMTQEAPLSMLETDLPNLPIITRDQPNGKQVEPDASVAAAPKETTRHPEPSISQNVTENPTDTANSPATQDTRLLVLELVPSILHKINFYDQSNVEQTETEAEIPASLTDTTTHQIFSNMQIDDSTDTECLSTIQNSSVNDGNETQDFNGKLQHIRQYLRNSTSMATSPHAVPKNSQSFTGTPTALDTSPSAQKTLLSVSELDSSDLHNVVTHDEPYVEHIEPGTLKPASLTETITHSAPRTSLSLTEDSTMPSFQARKQRTRKWKTKCPCPNCSIDGGNKTTGSNGKPQHVCHIPGCGRVFIYIKRLKQHLNWHSNTKKIRKHSRKPLICRCPNCKINDGNKTRYLKGKQLHVCHFVNCERVFIYIRALKKHLNWHKQISRKKRSTDFSIVYQPNVEQKEREASSSASSPETITHSASSNSQSLNRYSTDNVYLSPTQDTHHFFQNLESPSPNSLVSNHCPLVEILPEATTDATANVMLMSRLKSDQSLFSSRELPTPPPPTEADVLLGARFASNTSPHYKTETEVQEPRSTSPTTVYFENLSILEDIDMTEAEDPQEHKRPLECRFSNDSNDDGNKMSDCDGELQPPDRIKVFGDCKSLLNDKKNHGGPSCNTRLSGSDSVSRSVKKQSTVEPKMSNVRQYVCHMAGGKKVYRAARQFQNHSLLHTQKKIYYCAHCNKGFTRKDYLKKHVRKHMDFKRTKCQCPNCIAEGGNQIKGPDGRLQHVCHISNCRKVFSQIRYLKKHLLSHRREKKLYYCDHCNEEFTRKDYLLVHVRRHMNFKRWKCQCPNCNVQGGNKTKGPDGRSQHICHIPNCRKVYSETWHLRKHLLSHERYMHYSSTKCKFPNCQADDGNQSKGPDGRLQHVCHIFNCRKVFSKIVYLKKHLLSHVPVMNYKRLKCQCPNCSVEGGNKTKGPDGRSLHSCHIPNCGKVYIETWHLKKHLVSHERKKALARKRRNGRFEHKDEYGPRNRKNITRNVVQSTVKQPEVSSDDEFYGFPEGSM